MDYLLALFIFMSGFAIGAWLFSGAKKRALLSCQSTQNPLSKSNVAGLLASVMIQKIPGLLPKVVLEKDKTIVFEHPKPKHRFHYIFVPKKDIRHIGELGDQDKEHLIDLFAAIVSQINSLKHHNYRVSTNGPGKQDVSYLHFHLGVDQ